MGPNERFAHDATIMSIFLQKRTFLILGFYSLSYGVWYHLLGSGFKNHKLLDFTHYLNPQWLKNDLFGSLYYLHSQPPLINLIIGIVFKLVPDYYDAVFRVLYFTMGAIALLALERTMVLFALSSLIRWAVLFMLFATPTLYMFGSWYVTIHLEFSIACCLMYLVARYCVEAPKQASTLVMLFSCCALLGLMRPQWHFLVFILLAGVLTWIGGRKMLRTALLCSLIFIIPIGGWYTKNLYVFGFWGPSSWFGANLAQVANGSGADIRHLKETGAIAADFPGGFDTDLFARAIPAQEIPAALEHPVLALIKTDDPAFTAYANSVAYNLAYNLNYYGIIPSARQDLHDSLVVIKSAPAKYANAVMQRFYAVHFIPSFHSRSLMLLSPHTPDAPPFMLAYYHFLEHTAFLFYAIIPVTGLLFSLFYPSNKQREFTFICFGFAFILLLIGCALNGGEQERMRWGWQSTYILMTAILLQNISSAVRYKWVKIQNTMSNSGDFNGKSPERLG